MPSTATLDPPAARYDDLDNYDVDDFSDDPFALPSPADKPTKKRKEPDSGLGIDKEVNVQKRARVPNVKLDEERLLGPAGIPKLRKRARDLKIKGKGHEFSDAARLLSFYQLWLHDLFPKAKFLDALAMVEKAGHKKRVMVARNEFIQEGKPRSAREEDGENGDDDMEEVLNENADAATGTSVVVPQQTPPPNDGIPDDADLYDATPHSRLPIRSHVPDEEGLNALIAEAEDQDQPNKGKNAAVPPVVSGANVDEEDLDALIAEAETEDHETDRQNHIAKDDFADEEAAMQEMDGLW